MANYNNIKTIRLFRRREDYIERTVIKEFFRFIGCLVHDVPVEDIEQYKEEIDKSCLNDVDIVLNADWLDWKTLYWHYDTEKERPKRIFIGWSLQNRICHAWTYKNGHEYGVKPEESTINLYEQLLEVLIKVIWDNCIDTESDALYINELKGINKKFFLYNMIEMLQTKRAFRILQMGETKKLPDENSNPVIKEKQYVSDMLESFIRMGMAVKDGKTVYSQYVWVNAARKAREIIALYDPEKIQQFEDDVLSRIGSGAVIQTMEDLFGKLQEIVTEDEQFVGAYFLGAYLSQREKDAEKKVNADIYYKLILEKIQDTDDAFIAFVCYHRGIYEEKYKKRMKYALEYYYDAIRADEKCYQSYFKLAWYSAIGGNLLEAKSNYEKVLRIFGIEKQNGVGYLIEQLQHLTLKELQYVFKAYIGLARLCDKSGNRAMSELYLNRALIVCNIYRDWGNIEDGISCIWNRNDERKKKFNEYHKKSKPTELLWRILKYNCQRLNCMELVESVNNAWILENEPVEIVLK